MIPPEMLTPILERPGDDTPRLALADWLEDNASSLPPGAVARAALIRVQCEAAGLACEFCDAGGARRADRVLDGVHLRKGDRCSGCKRAFLAGREADLLTAIGRDMLVVPLPWWHVTTAREAGRIQGGSAGWAFVGRGFVASASCPLADWQRHAAPLLSAHPLESVTVSDVPGLSFEVRRGSGWAWEIVGRLGTPSLATGQGFPGRPAMVTGVSAAIASITSRLRYLAGPRWPQDHGGFVLPGEFAQAVRDAVAAFAPSMETTTAAVVQLGQATAEAFDALPPEQRQALIRHAEAQDDE